MFGAEIAGIRGYNPTVARALDPENAPAGQHLSVIGAHPAGKILHQPVGFQIRGVAVKTHPDNHFRVQDRDHRHCILYRDLLHRHGFQPGHERGAIMGAADQHHPARRQYAAIGGGVVDVAGPVQNDRAGLAVGLLKHRRRAAGGVVAKPALGLKNGHIAQFRQPRRC